LSAREVAERLNWEHKNWLRLFLDAKERGMDDLAIVYARSGIDCGNRMLAAQYRAEKEDFDRGKRA